MTRTKIRSKEELVALIRARKNELDLSDITLCSLTGLADGYIGKLLSPTPKRNFGALSLDAVLQALALKIVTVVIEEDPVQVAKMSRRWVRRKRAPVRGLYVADVGHGRQSQREFDLGNNGEGK